MLSALHNEEWLVHSHPFSSFGDMENEIAELRTLTKVTKLRQQIECRQEGSWMVVRNVPDEKAKSGTRKVTSYGRTSRSVTRSFSQNVAGKSFECDDINPSNVVIELPPDNSEEKESNSNKSVEITEVIDEPCQKATEVVPVQTPAKKTSVVTLGKGNIVLMDDEDSNFQVTGISKGRVAEAVSTLERGSQGEKKVKKVGFCKTEVHFAPDSGRVKIVETDEKPPPTQMLRKKKRSRNRTSKSDLPKLYFGNSSTDDFKDLSQLTNSQTATFPIIREPSPLLTLSATAQVTKKLDEKSDNYGFIKKVVPKESETKNEEKSTVSYLGNVSPKLSKLLQNNMQHEFQAKQKLIMKKKESLEECKQVNVHVACDSPSIKPLKIVTQVSLGAGGGEVEHKFMLKTGRKESEPIYVNKDVTTEVKSDSGNKRSTLIKEKIPKPRPRTTVVIPPQVKEVKNTKVIKQVEKLPKRGVTPKKEIGSKKESLQFKPVPSKHCSRSPSKSEKTRSIKSELNHSNIKVQKQLKTSSGQEKPPEVKVRKVREPLRSFEKVSNGWVGHCITPVKGTTQNHSRAAQVTVTTKVISNKSTSTAHSIHNQGMKRSNVTSGTKHSSRLNNETKIQSKSSLTENKQFSLSKEHLRSAKLVKEISLKDKQLGGAELTLPKKHYSSLTNSKTKEVSSQILGSRVPPRVGVVRPRIVQQSHSTIKNNSTTAVRIGLPRNEHSLLRQRRDSEQSDDSVVRADEEVRAYMFNSRHKVVFADYVQL